MDLGTIKNLTFYCPDRSQTPEDQEHQSHYAKTQYGSNAILLKKIFDLLLNYDKGGNTVDIK